MVAHHRDRSAGRGDQLVRALEPISKWGEQLEYAKARSEARDSRWTYSEGRARKRQSNRAVQPILRSVLVSEPLAEELQHLFHRDLVGRIREAVSFPLESDYARRYARFLQSRRQPPRLIDRNERILGTVKNMNGAAPFVTKLMGEARRYMSGLSA